MNGAYSPPRLLTFICVTCSRQFVILSVSTVAPCPSEFRASLRRSTGNICGLSRIVSVTLNLRAFHFGLGYICRENDDLMVFQILSNRRITHVKEAEAEEERGSLSEGKWRERGREGGK